MSAACGATAKVEPRIELRTRIKSWGIEIETWQLLETRTLPTESARLPLSTIFGNPGQGALPAALTDDDDTLETPIGEITRENEVAQGYLEITAERVTAAAGEDLAAGQEVAADAGPLPVGPRERTTSGGSHGR